VKASARSLLPRFVALLVFWLMLEGVNPAGLLIGVPATVLATWLARLLIPPGGCISPVGSLAFCAHFLWSSLLAGIDVAIRALHPRLPLRTGLVFKNGIVLIDEINSQLASGKAAWNAVVDASVSRVRPVSMAVLTTVFGLIPLLFDVFFGAMAVTIVVGLLFASALTLFVVPVLYATFFKVRSEKESISQYVEADAPSRA
jgi:hypothetical protein